MSIDALLRSFLVDANSQRNPVIGAFVQRVVPSVEMRLSDPKKLETFLGFCCEALGAILAAKFTHGNQREELRFLCGVVGSKLDLAVDREIGLQFDTETAALFMCVPEPRDTDRRAIPSWVESRIVVLGPSLQLVTTDCLSALLGLYAIIERPSHETLDVLASLKRLYICSASLREAVVRTNLELWAPVRSEDVGT